jgi:TPR repeat protein
MNRLAFHSRRRSLFLPAVLPTTKIIPLSGLAITSASTNGIVPAMPRTETVRLFHRPSCCRLVRQAEREALPSQQRQVVLSSCREDRSYHATKRRDHFFSSSSSLSLIEEDAAVDNTATNEEGANLYRRYLEIQDQVKELERAEEQLKSQRMFEAWKKAADVSSAAAESSSSSEAVNAGKATNNDNNNKGSGQSTLYDRKAGVAVIRTLAKETARPGTTTTTQERVQELRHQAAQLLALAADTHLHPPALVRMGNDALSEQQDTTRAMQYYRQAGERGSAEGWLHLGHCLWERIGGSGASLDTDTDDASSDPNSAQLAAALDAFWNAANLGDDDAKYFLGVHLLGNDDDDSTDNDIRKGLDLMQSAAAAGHGGALHYLVLFYRNGNDALGVPPCSPGEFMERLDRAVQHDTDGDSYFLRGSCRLAGDVYEKSPPLALEDFLMASDLGQSDAAISAGALLHHGVPDQIAQDRRKAFELYQHAGELGNLEGWRNVVSCYLQGHGVPQSTSIAKYIAETMLRPTIS